MAKNYLFEGERARDYYQRTKESEHTFQTLDFILENTELNKGSLVADLAAGSGNFTSHLKAKVKRIDAVDLSEEMVKIMDMRFKEDEGVKVVKSSISKVPLESNAYDAVILIMSLHHVGEGKESLKEAARILKPGGRLILVDRLARDKKLAEEFDIQDAKERGIEGGHGHTQRTVEEVEAMLKQDFRILKKVEQPYEGEKGKALVKMFYSLERI